MLLLIAKKIKRKNKKIKPEHTCSAKIDVWYVEVKQHRMSRSIPEVVELRGESGCMTQALLYLDVTNEPLSETKMCSEICGSNDATCMGEWIASYETRETPVTRREIAIKWEAVLLTRFERFTNVDGLIALAALDVLTAGGVARCLLFTRQTKWHWSVCRLQVMCRCCCNVVVRWWVVLGSRHKSESEPEARATSRSPSPSQSPSDQSWNHIYCKCWLILTERRRAWAAQTRAPTRLSRCRCYLREGDSTL